MADNTISWYIENQVKRTIDSLRKNNMYGVFANNAAELKQHIEQLIPEGSTVGIGDSMTLFDTGIINLLQNGSYNFLDKYRNGITSEEKKKLYRANFSADTFLSGTNAITENGELYNIDGNGSRVAPMIYGPEQVIIVAGINKIVKNLDEAEKRVRNYAAPLDAKRLNKKTPCSSLGYCTDCKSPERICNDFVVIRRQFIKNRIKVIIIRKHLGY
ncbi:lactate utilization protein [Pectinatus frisingensis]|uniref:lactate utilization protein n=1 Tax=Pectinatus frisingensis TaxID=865 RepID=UPI0018C6E464|nr:lactate utilization protein [Pectinatus frisingensis]